MLTKRAHQGTNESMDSAFKKSKNEEIKSDAVKNEEEEIRSTEPDADTRTSPIFISMYAEKGGVSKTTLSGTLAWCLAQQHRVLVYDCDSQRNLSAWLLGAMIEAAPYNGDYNRFVHGREPDNQMPRTLFDQLDRSRQGSQAVEAALPIKVSARINLWIVPGHKDISSFDGHISAAEATALAFPANRNLTGAPFHAVLATARTVNAQYVIMDLNPSAGALNRCLIMASDYIIVPAIADFFSKEMMESLKLKLIAWFDEIATQRPIIVQGLHPFPSTSPKFLGYFLSRFRSVNRNQNVLVDGLATDDLPINTGSWATKVRSAADGIASDPTLRGRGMVLDPAVYHELNRCVLLGKIRNWGQMADLSAMFHYPVPYLLQTHLVHHKNGRMVSMTGFALETALEEVDCYKHMIGVSTETIIKVIEADQYRRPGLACNRL